MSHQKKALEANLSDIFSKLEDQGTHVGRRLLKMISESKTVTAPPFPRQIQIETSNICNHKCEFCAYTLMRRPKGYMDKALFDRLVKEAFDCGAREIGLFAGAEPLTCKWLDKFIESCRDIGYEYIYISTNGVLADGLTLKNLLDAGLNSIKFSVNGGNRETYKIVHGKDDFDKVIENIKHIAEYKKNTSCNVYLGVSFVGMDHSRESFGSLKSILDGVVDEIIYYEASNQSGQMPGFPNPPYRECHLPFNKVHISREGFLKACCNDYENLLAVEDLNLYSMKDAWLSDRFKELRLRHIENKLEGTVCGNCIRASAVPPKPLNPDLISHSVFWQSTLIQEIKNISLKSE